MTDASAPARPRLAYALLALAGACFLTANLIHNRWGFDPAVLPMLVFGAAAWFRPAVGWFLATVVAIAVPSFAFTHWDLLRVDDTLVVINQAALAIGGSLALLAGAWRLLAVRGRAGMT